MGQARKVDSSYHVWTSVSVRRGIIWGISVHSIHKGVWGVVIIECVHLEKYQNLWNKSRCTKGDPKV